MKFFFFGKARYGWADAVYVGSYGADDDKVYQCPVNPGKLKTWGTTATDYMANTYGAFGGDANGTDSNNRTLYDVGVISWGTGAVRCVNTIKLTAPASVVFLADSFNGTLKTQAYSVQRANATAGSQTAAANTPHGRMCNMAFVDGHASSLKPREFFDNYYGNTSIKDYNSSVAKGFIFWESSNPQKTIVLTATSGS